MRSSAAVMWPALVRRSTGYAHLGGRGQVLDGLHVVGGRAGRGRVRRRTSPAPSPVRPAGVDQRLGSAQQRVAREVGGHLALAAVAELGVGARVAQEPHGAQVQDRGLPGRADPSTASRAAARAGERVRAVGLQVGEPRPGRQRRLDPARRAGHRDAPAVVLDTRRSSGSGSRVCTACAGGVEGADGRRVVDRGVAEAGDHDGVLGPRGRDADPRRAVQREREADRPGQVRGDRRGLGDDVQGGVAEDLVPPAGDRLVAGGGQPEQHVADRVVAGDLAGPRAVEAARAVVQQRRVGRPQRHRDGRVALVAGRADRVEALARGCSRRASRSRCRLSACASNSARKLRPVAGRHAGRRQRGDRRAEVLVEARRHPTHDAAVVARSSS